MRDVLDALKDALRASWAERRKPVVAVPLALFFGFLLWGPDGKAPILDPLLGGLDPTVAWMVRFAFGALVMVVVPWLVIRFWIAAPSEAPLPPPRSAEDWGLGLGHWKVGLPLALILGVVLGVGTSQMAPNSPELLATYPLFRPAQPGPALFWSYEAAYLLFFVAGELGMRGILLFGARRWLASGTAAVILAALPQLIWHLHKPASEMWVAGFWGLAVGALALGLRSAWWGVVFHWLSNVALDVASYAEEAGNLLGSANPG